MNTVVTSQPITLYGRLEYQFRKLAVDAQADQAFARIVEQSSLFLGLENRLIAITQENASLKSRFAKMLKIADRIAEAISPHAGCQRMCSHCCNISVGLSAAEARHIGAAIGVTPRSNVSSLGDRSALIDRYFGEPCPFLENQECSIYAHRPVACRLHFTLDRDGYFCSTQIHPEDSLVPAVNLETYWMMYGYLALQIEDSEGDIRQFFPNGRQVA